MVRGNWQRRVERTEARRTAAKLQKERRRDKRNNTSSSSGGGASHQSHRRLEEWLDENGDGIGASRDDGGGRASAGVGGNGSITVDVWTDARPVDRAEYVPISEGYDVDEDDWDDEEGGNGKGRSKGKQKERQYRGKTKKSKGRAHPNAKNKSSQDGEGVGRERSGSTASHQNSKDDGLCGREFFFGKNQCKGSKQLKQQAQKKGGRRRSDSFGGDDAGCGLQHYHQLPKPKRVHRGTIRSPPMTLVQVLNEKFSPRDIHGGVDDGGPEASLPPRVREAALKSSFDAAADDADGSSRIDMVYHSRFIVENKVESGVSDDQNDKGQNFDENNNDDQDGDDQGQSDNDEQEDDNSDDDDDGGGNDAQKSKLHAALEQALDGDKLPATSIVYLAIQGVLIYDRHRGGLILSAKEERFLLYGDVIDDVVDEDPDNNEDEPMHIHEQLTHHLLDEILSYAGDEVSAVLPRVCPSWRDEVGTRSPQLWKTLLGRHDWPSSVNGEDCDGLSDGLEECQWFKNTFISHYSVVRNVRALINAVDFMAGGNVGARANGKQGVESALQIFKSTQGSPAIDANDRCIVRIWSDDMDGSASPRALAAYPDLTLRLFEVHRGNSSSGASASIKCRQAVCVRAAPPSISRKKHGCRLMSMDLDEDVVACFVVEHGDGNNDAREKSTVPWMTVISRDNVVCAGNEGMLDDESIRSFDLRASVLDYLLNSSADTFHEELRVALHSILAISDGDTSDIKINVTPKLIACGKGHFLFHAYIYSEVPLDGEDGAVGSVHMESCGHRLFLFSSRDGTIEKSLHLERYREGTSLFASRPFKRRANGNAPSALCTNILVSGPTMSLLMISVEVRRDRTSDVLMTSMIEGAALSPWSRMSAALTSSHAVFSTDPVQGPVLHFWRMPSHHGESDERAAPAHLSIELGGPDCRLVNIFVVREHYVAVIFGTCPEDEAEEDEAFDGHWFGHDETSLELSIYHVPTRREMFRSPVSSGALSADCVGDALAATVSDLGFVMTGGNARDVAGGATASNEDPSRMVGSPSGKTPKGKKKRLASLASGRKKDGFARGMSLRG